jgi:MFS family permease
MKNKGHFRKFLLLWSGEMVSSVGGGLTSFGLSVYVFRMTGRAADTALVALLAFLLTLLLSIPAGVLADRADRRLLMVIGDGCSAIGVIYILICMINGGAALWQICAGVFVSSVFSSLLEPAYRATITDLLDEEQFSKASGIMGLAGSARYLISPLLAGLLLTVSDIKIGRASCRERVQISVVAVSVKETPTVRVVLTPNPGPLAGCMVAVPSETCVYPLEVWLYLLGETDVLMKLVALA